jgi:serine protease inhibitor
MIVMPNTETDMKQYTKESNYNSLNEIVAQLETIDVQLFVPKFRFECTSRAEKALGKVRKAQ